MSNIGNTQSEIENLYKNFPGTWDRVDMNILFDMYLNADQYGKDSLFFILLKEYISLSKMNEKCKMAHISYLISYLLLNIIYVENRAILALEFAEKANKLSGREEYKDWIEVIKEDIK